jgi:hypothetical protein
LKEEEAKYQAHMLSQELEKMRLDEEAASRASERANKKGAKRSASKLSHSYLLLYPTTLSEKKNQGLVANKLNLL